LNNKSKINTSKGKLYLTVVALASLLVMAFNLNANMNAHASIFENIQNVDDVGQSLECVIVVVGCDAQGSVGSSGDVNIGVGDNDTTTGGETPIDPDCEAGIACFVSTLNPTQLGNLKFVLGLPVDAPNELLCDVIDDLTAAELRAAITAPVVGVTDAVATVIINCLIDAGFTNLE
jgi:hypothetical protein